MEDWIFGTAEQINKAITLNVLKERQCKNCVFLHIQTLEEWCKKKCIEPVEGVCEYWENGNPLALYKLDSGGAKINIS